MKTSHTSGTPNYKEADICQWCKNIRYAESTGSCFNIPQCKITNSSTSITGVCDKFKERKK